MPKVTDALVERAVSVYASRTRAPMPVRETREQYVATVAGTRMVGPGMRRLTLQSDGLRELTLCGPDEYVGLLMPRVGVPLTMPDPERTDPRAAVHDIPEAQRPDLRWYTVAALRPESGEMDVDVIDHGDSGPGSAWAGRAAVGDEVGVKTAGACYVHPGEGRRQLFVGDETALPAIAAMCAAQPDGSHVSVVLELADPVLTQSYSLPADVQVVRRGDTDPGTAVLAELQSRMPALAREVDYAWACGESALATGVRRLLVHGGLKRTQVFFSGYWKLGAARG